MRARSWREERGSAVVEFALVAPLLLFVALAVLQVILALHVRSSLTSAAAEGARAGALAQSSTAAAERRTRDILRDVIGGDTVSAVQASRQRVNGLGVIEVRVTARLPLVGLLGPTAMTVEGHAVQEGP